MLRRLATLKAAKKNAGFALSSSTSRGVGTAGLPHELGSNLFDRAKNLAFFYVFLLKI